MLSRQFCYGFLKKKILYCRIDQHHKTIPCTSLGFPIICIKISLIYSKYASSGKFYFHTTPQTFIAGQRPISNRELSEEQGPSTLCPLLPSRQMMMCTMLFLFQGREWNSSFFFNSYGKLMINTGCLDAGMVVWLVLHIAYLQV